MAQKVLLIVIDQFRADCINASLDADDLKSESKSVGGAGLAKFARLPNLQSLIRESMTFNQHYTVTTPCGPSRASLLTGLYAKNHRSVRNRTPLATHHKTIGTYMRTVGFEPMLFGYTDVSTDPRGRHPNDPDLKDYEGLAQGFSEMLRMRAESAGPWVGNLKLKGYNLPEHYWDLYRPELDVSTATEQDPAGSPIRSPARYTAQDSDTAFLTDRTLEALYGCADTDWFSMVTYIKPHPPLVAPAPFNTQFEPSSIPEPNRALSIEQLRASHPFFDGYFSEPSNTGLYMGFDGDFTRLSDEHVAELRAVYLGLAYEVDQHIGRLIHFLRETDQYEDTLIVVTADHGEMLGDQHQWGKSCPLDPALHIPLIIRDPKRPQSHGTVTDRFTESVDIAATLLEWSNGEQPQALNGRSLVPFLEGNTPENWRTHVYAEAEFGEPDKPTGIQQSLGLPVEQANYAVLRTELYKYVHFNGGLPPLLFDVKADPYENQNLAADAAYAQVLLQMSGMMLDHRMSHAEHSLSRLKLTESGVYPPVALL